MPSYKFKYFHHSDNKEAYLKLSEKFLYILDVSNKKTPCFLNNTETKKKKLSPL